MKVFFIQQVFSRCLYVFALIINIFNGSFKTEYQNHTNLWQLNYLQPIVSKCNWASGVYLVILRLIFEACCYRFLYGRLPDTLHSCLSPLANDEMKNGTWLCFIVRRISLINSEATFNYVFLSTFDACGNMCAFISVQFPS